MEPIKILPVIFFQEPSGNESVKRWLRDLTEDDRKTIGKHIRIIQIDWPIGSPVVKSLGRKLWEIRISLDNRIARIIFVIHDGSVVLLHGFIKKTQKNAAWRYRSSIKTCKKSSGGTMKENKYLGSSFESFLEEEGILEEVNASAIKAVIAHHLQEHMTKKQITQTDMAKQLGTSRSGLQRLLDPHNTSITLLTLNKAATILGKRIEMSLVTRSTVEQ